MIDPVRLTLSPWESNDLDVLVVCNTPEMTAFVGGPEPEEAVLRRHEKYVREWEDGRVRMFTVRLDRTKTVGSVGYWPIEWAGAEVYESGWSTLPEWQGRGVATSGIRLLLDHARVSGDLDSMHAFPLVEHHASNAVCRKAGFSLLGPVPFPGRQGATIVCNDWSVSFAR